MRAAWDVLVRGGVPLAGRPAGPPPSETELADAVRTALRAPPPAGSREADALRAFLLAWRAHWPTSWAAAFATEETAVGPWAEWGDHDPGRIVKLRRIAIESLATIL